MPAYFADTSFWIAVSSRRDQYHAQSIAWHKVISQSGSRIVTTEAVLWEWLNALSDASTRAVAAEGYRLAHADRGIDVVGFRSDLGQAAIQLYRTRADKDWSLTDCLSFVVMEERGLTEALTTDRHFEQAGFRARMLDIPQSPQGD